jgi:serine/threonine-protein kinase
MGGGGMSRLFLARDRQFDRTVVIKILTPSDLDRISIDRFRREITVATSLQHPNIVPILSAGELGTEPRIPFFIMPFVDGESLRERLLRGPLSVREAVHIARDVARALRHAHERGIVHRDIKPGNVLLSAGAAVVSDFGVAKALLSSRQPSRSGGVSNPGVRRVAQPSLTALGTSLGTPAYMAPEQAAADPNVDHRADIYALGIVLYEMLVGAPPFQGRSPQELLRAQLADPPPPIASRRYDVPALLAELISRCLEKEPGRRPKSAADVLSWLDDPAVVSGAFVNAATPSARTFGMKGTYRGVLISIVALIALAALYMSVADSAATGAAKADSAAAAADAASLAAPVGPSRQLVIGPLSAVGGDARARLLGDALASELAVSLANVPGIRVGAQVTRSRDASPVRDSAGAGALPDSAAAPMLRLEGTVQRENAEFRVLLRAIDTGADSTLWSGSFDGRADSLFALQRRVALEVTFALNNLLLSRAPR